jgi:hypothetical protein
VSPTTADANKPDFSGSYTLKHSKKASKAEREKVWTLQVKQTESAIQVTRVMDAHPNTNEFPLNGGEGRYVSPGGPAGTCKARWKGKTLVLDSLVIAHPQANGPAVQLHTKERWELSSDLKTLTIRSDVDFPGSLVNNFQLVEPWTEIYTRN